MQFRSTLSLDCYTSFPSRHMLDLSRNRTWEAIDSFLPLKKCHHPYRDELHLKRHYCVILYHEYIYNVT